MFVTLAYLGLAVVMYLPAWFRGPASHLQAPGGDIAIFVWSLRSVAHSIAHLHNPFFSDWLNYPGGVNLLDNTTVVLLGALSTPVTLAFGPIASFNLLQTLALGLSALSAFALLRRWTTWTPAAFAGGLLFGFSPYVISEGWGHLHLTFVALIPLIAICLDEILVGQRGSPVRWGIALGVLAAAQFLISSEMLADTTELSVLALVLLALEHREQIRPRLRHAARGGLSALLTGSVLLAYPLWFALAGPQHGTIPFSRLVAELYSSDLLEPIIPTSNQLLSTAGLTRHGDALSGGLIPFGPGAGAHEVTNAGYLGIPLLLIVLVLVLRYRRDALVRLFVPLTLAAFVLALGPTLKVNGHLTGFPLPERLIAALPGLRATVPLRYGLFYTLGAAVLLGIGLDRLRDGGRSRRGARWWVAPALATTCALVPLLPPSTYTMRAVAIPDGLTAPGDARIAPGSVVLTYPPPRPTTSVTMEWQAADFRYRMIGAYMFAPTDGTPSFTLIPNQSPLEMLLSDIYIGEPAPGVTPMLRRAIRAQLTQWSISRVIVATDQPHAATAASFFRSVLRSRPRYGGGTAMWTVWSTDRNAG